MLNPHLIAVLAIILCFECLVLAVPYDYSFTSECLAKPLVPQYDGGVVLNPQLDEGLKGWTSYGDSKIEHAESNDGNKYIVSSGRNTSYHSFSQKFHLEKDKLYTFSGWFQVSHGNAEIAAIFKTKTSHEIAGWVTAKNGCWSMLKGGFVVNTSGPADLYFKSNNKAVGIWADSISLQPFSQDEWKSHQHQSIEESRKTRVRLQAVDQHGRPVANAAVTIKQQSNAFPFGCAINQNIMSNTAYQSWFLSRFKYTVFENELKWYATEKSRGNEDYSVADNMINFCKSNGLTIRGHNVLWNDPNYQPAWVGGLSPDDLSAAANKRVSSVVGRYSGKLFQWDVVNENLHFNFFESKLGGAASARIYQQVNKIDGKTTPFLNEYNTIEENRDGASSPSSYLKKISQLRSQGYNGPLGIGLEGHFNTPNLAYIRSAIDTLASAQLPIWITELDVSSGPNQATYLDQILREVHSHSAVQGIMLWSAWSPQGCYKMCLTDNNFKNLATGDVVDKFIATLGSRHEAADSYGTTDSDGFFEASLFHGDYVANITHPAGVRVSDFQSFKVRSDKEAPIVEIKVDL